MNKEKVESEIKPMVESMFELKGIHEVNWKVDGQPGHPFTIGTQHVVHASDHHSGMLGDATIDVIPCAHPKCHQPHDVHSHDTVLFLSLKRDLKPKEAREVLGATPLTYLMGQNKIDGFGFVEGEFKFLKEKK